MDTNELLTQIASMLEDQTKEIQLTIENNVTKKIDGLIDGYKLTHEKQWELERKTERLESIIDNLQNRLTVLENKTA